MIITLRCRECENMNCVLCPLGSWINDSSLKGCTRVISEDDYIHYEHMSNEVMPFLKMNNNQEYKKEAYKEYISLLQKIYTCPIGANISNNGKLMK